MNRQYFQQAVLLCLLKALEYAPMLHVSYYAQNYAGIIRHDLQMRGHLLVNKESPKNKIHARLDKIIATEDNPVLLQCQHHYTIQTKTTNIMQTQVHSYCHGPIIAFRGVDITRHHIHI